MRVQVLAVLLAVSAVGCELVGGIDERQATGKAKPAVTAAGNGVAGEYATSAGTGPTAGAVAQERTLCQQYCSAVKRACTGEWAVYGDETQCMSVCAALEEGSPSDVKVNTIGCRLNQARAISTEPVDCHFAGPGGGNLCGDNCDSYCELMSHACGEEEYRSYWLGDVERCKLKCRALRDLDTSQLDDGESHYSALNAAARDHDGDTVQCRLFHAVSAIASPSGHCWHAALQPAPDKNMSSNPCAGNPGQTAPECSDYCRLHASACDGDSASYESDAQCMAVCRTFTPGTLADKGGGGEAEHNTLGCRYTHTYNALVNPDPAVVASHCSHSGPGGTDVCGGDCDSYCDQLEEACPAQFASLGGKDSCASECKGLLVDGMKVKYSVALARSGKSPLACRFLAVARALTSRPASPAAWCEIAVGHGECK